MKKKILSILLIVTLVLCMTACSNKSSDNDDTTATTESVTEEPTTEQPTETTSEEPQETTSSATEEPTEEPSEESTEETQEATSNTEESTSEQADIVIPEVDVSTIASSAVEGTTAEAPAEVGTWIKSTRYCPTSSSYETVYWRIVGTTFDCQEDIDRYNSEDHLIGFEELENELFSYCKVVYQVYFPEEFTAYDWGISATELSVRALNPEGGGIKYQGISYIGLGTCYDISVDQEIMPGDVFTGEAIFIMIDAPEIEYIFEYAHQELGKDGEMLYDYSKHR